MQELIMQLKCFEEDKKTETDVKQEYNIGKLMFNYNELKLYTAPEIISLYKGRPAQILASNTNKILKREEVLINVWGKDDYFLGRSMDVFITKLRKHFKADPGIVLETIHGVGFRLNQ